MRLRQEEGHIKNRMKRNIVKIKERTERQTGESESQRFGQRCKIGVNEN